MHSQMLAGFIAAYFFVMTVFSLTPYLGFKGVSIA